MISLAGMLLDICACNGDWMCELRFSDVPWRYRVSDAYNSRILFFVVCP